MEVAGTVTVQIGGNIAPLEQALAKAQQLAATFDAQITQKLSGAGVSDGLAKIAAGVEKTNELLAKMSGSTNGAKAALTQIETSSKQATAAIAQVGAAAATASNEINRIGAGGAAAGLTAATVGAKEFAAALEAAGGDLTKVNVGLTEQKAEVKAVTDALRGYSQAEVDAFRSQQNGAEFNRDLNERVGILDSATKSARDSAASFQAFGLTQTEVAMGVRNVTTELGHGASAAGIGAAQMMSLSHAGRSAVESLALGVSPLQALTMQANHLSFALTGPQGVIAATAGARAAFAGWITSIPGILTTAGVAAAAGVAAYVISTRNSIQSVDQVLTEHKALIDEIAAAYPEAAKAAKQYEEVAKNIPQSVASADIADKVKENQKTLDDTLGFLSIRLQGLSEEFGLFGSKGAAAFGELAAIGKSGAADAADRIESALGRMRLDPSLNENTRDFAKQLQASATEAAKLQDALSEKSAVKTIVDNNARAVQTLFSVSQGFKDVKSSAGSADETITKLFGQIGSGQRFGVTKSLGLDGIVTQTQQAGAAIQQMRQQQVQSMLELNQQFRDTTQKVADLKQAIATGAGKENIEAYFGDVSNIKNANGEIQNAITTVTKLFDALNTGSATANTVATSLEMIRQQLVNDGFRTDQVEKFIGDLVAMRMQLDAGSAQAKQLNAAIQAIKNRTVTITVVTRQVGTGTQSLYDVPSSNGGTSSVGVTRYGGTSDMTQESYSVPSSGYGSQGGTGDSPTGTVTVTRFGGTRAGGGPIDALKPYLVGENGPEIVLPNGAGTVIPNAQSVMLANALANPQSGFTGTQPTSEYDRMWTVQMNIEANTRKTTQILDDIKTSTAASASAFGGGSSSVSGSSSGVPSDQAAWDAAYSKAFAAAQANYQAARAAGGGDGIVPFAQGLVATPAQIARNAANLATGRGGTRSVLGFDTGGMIAPGDTQHVQFFKSPEETVAIFTPQQMKALRGENQNQPQPGGQRPISVHVPVSVTVQSGAQVDNDSIGEMTRQLAVFGEAIARSVNGGG
ncbi:MULTISPECIES: hypothetical protein [unclassified Mesorhizobium]|uniref:hypothetical protein n=1 Tax=unclassified Mesorhizobium TaxID=325217 RepID=UPI000FCC692A|nr:MULTISPECIES: hypothetical protein [unclassified Mesorhizobium]TGU44630.1 hypothetical protein EN789_21745 [bacterium M00.F.Ca.ET.146.01.1.1]TGU58458.1 hypothetical protein EN791_021745 [Mesorhizobium sp. M2D.F.Ca.ET.148.01.1.1]TGU64390.1 hypothetical protein EN790_21740 [Mesorhizobium sp. M2D.F.Ca.ET.147.01.1.1]